MPRHRFFVPPGTLAGGDIALGPALAHRIGRVLRLAAGDRIYLFDGSGREVEAEVAAVTRGGVRATPVAERYPDTEPGAHVTLCQALLPGDRFEWVLEKGTELGVGRFVPLLCERGTARPAAGRGGERKLERWRAVVRSAAEQSRRVRLPAIDEPTSLPTCLDAVEGPAIVAWEQATAPLDPALAAATASGCRTLWLFVGPEGGFTEAEAALAADQGAHLVSLGRRILRSETAGIVLAALALHHCGELEPSAPAAPASPGA